MTLRTKAELLGGALLLALMFLVGWEQLRQHDLNLTASAQAVSDQAAQGKIDAALKVRDAQYQQQTDLMQQKYAALAKMTPAQVVQRVPIYIPQASAPIQIVGPDTPPAKLGDAIVPQIDIKPIATAVLDGDQCKLDRAKCQADKTDLTEKLKLSADETAQWKQAAKGGSVWQRVKKDVVIIAVSGAVAYTVGRIQK